jgi:uncharacterized protein (TIGR02996 family)
LSAIVANHEEDAPRLVFADWLQEAGDEERAEFIRDQIALERAYPKYRDEAFRELTFTPDTHDQYERTRRLLASNAQKWLAGFPRGAGAAANDLVFHRGFPSSVQLTPNQWAEEGEWLRRWVPLEGVSLDGQAERFPELMMMPTLFGLSELSLNRVGTDELRELANSPALDTLESLRIQGRNHAGTVEVPALRRLFGGAPETPPLAPRLDRPRRGHAGVRRERLGASA